MTNEARLSKEVEVLRKNANHWANRAKHWKECAEEMDKAIHRLPRPLDRIGDGPDERVGYALECLKTRDRALKLSQESCDRREDWLKERDQTIQKMRDTMIDGLKTLIKVLEQF